ncbi:MAG: lamin tail domain-containing protein, partial [Flavobacteriales bacterium]|nr:lamin tail domain-containing protein [Flavobacteriales bacterium]
DETIILELQNPNGATYCSDSVHTITIPGNDANISPCANLFFSEYFEGSSNNKALELYNPTSDSIDLSLYTINTYSNGATSASNTLSPTGMLGPGDVYVITNASASNVNLIANSDVTSSVTFFNGNDAVGLFQSADTIDVIGIIGVDPGTEWVVGTGSTLDNTLVRKDSIQEGQKNWVVGASEWLVFAQDDSNYIGAHTIIPCVLASASADFSSNSPACLGDSVCFTDLSTPGEGAITTWFWTFGDGNNSTNQNPCHTYTTEGPFTVTLAVMDDSLNVDTSTGTIVNIDTAASATAGTNDTICAGDGLNLAGTIGGSASSSTWTTGGDGTFSDSSLLNSSYTAGAADISAGTVTLYLTTDNPAGACGAVMDSMTLVINPAATSAAGADQTICIADPVTVNGTIGGSATSSTWITLGDGSFADSSLLTTTYTTGPTDNGMGSVNIVLMSNDPTGPCPAASDTMVVTISAPAVVSAGSDQTICADMACLSLSGTVTGITTTGIWTTTGGGAFTAPTVLNTCYTPDAADTASGSVTLILTSTANGVCAAEVDSAILSINPLPAFGGIVTIDSSSCGNSDGNITGITASGVATLTFSWVNSVPAVVGSAADLLLVPAQCYTLSVIDGNGCVAASGPHCVNDAGTPGAPTAGADGTHCVGDTPTDLTATGTGGTLYWFNDALLTDTAATGSPFASGATSTDTFYVAELGACLSLADTVIVTFNPKAVVDAGIDVTTCVSSGCIALSGSVTVGASTGIWTASGSGIFSPNDSDLSACYTPSAGDTASGSVDIILTSTNNGVCASVSDTLTITFTPAPAVNAGPDQAACFDGTCLPLSGTVTQGGSTGQWSTLGSGSFVPNDSDLVGCYMPSAADSAAGSVILVLISTNNGTCAAVSDTMVITFGPKAVVDAGPDQTTCTGAGCVTLAGSISGGSSTGMWTSMGTGTFTPNDSDLAACYLPSAADDVSGTVTLILTSTNNGACAAVTDTMVITIGAGAVVDAGPDQTACGTGCVTLAGVVSGAT